MPERETDAHVPAGRPNAVEAARSFFLTAVCAFVFPMGASAGGSPVFAVASFAAVYLVFYLMTAWAFDRRGGTAPSRRLFHRTFHAAFPSIKLKGAAMMACGLGMLADLACSLLCEGGPGRGWSLWPASAAALCGHADAVLVFATPPGTLRGVLAGAARAGMDECLSARSPFGHGPRGAKDSNGRRKEPEDHDLA